MHRSRIILAVSALTLVFTVAACKSGPSDPASYRAAMKGMTPALTKLAMTTRDASTSGDPMQLSSALGKTVSSAKSLMSLVKKIEVSEPSLSGIHADLLTAATNHVATLEEAALEATSTPIPQTKGLMNDSTEELLNAVQAWNDDLDAL
jgi:hypothetical protein